MAQAKARFADLLRRAEAGEEVEITRYGRPVARLVGSAPGSRTPLVGALRGRISIAPDFDEMPPGFLDALSASVEPTAMPEPGRTTRRPRE